MGWTRRRCEGSASGGHPPGGGAEPPPAPARLLNPTTPQVVVVVVVVGSVVRLYLHTPAEVVPPLLQGWLSVSRSSSGAAPCIWGLAHVPRKPNLTWPGAV
ncbi:hypothetical protein PLESTF_000021300 [Pleodorina starrii]|nr:hypothetical protein PLESTF_000021300 [Pleodorina starrii]